MRVVAAPAPFKAACSAAEAARAIAAAARSLNVDVVECPVADGGEGTRDAIVSARGGRLIRRTVHDPLGREIDAEFGLIPDRTVVVELAAASGYERLSPAERNAEITSTFGTGELIRAALDEAPTSIIVAVGGSATVDGGMGIIRALGGRFLDADGRELEGRGADTGRVRSVDLAGLDARLADVELLVACDVRNPLCGPRGAARVFGPQKGADESAVERLDGGLDHLGRALAESSGVDVRRATYAGAAGGAAGGMAAALGARLIAGAELVLDSVHFSERLSGASLVITGEGSLDDQSLEGKAVAAVASRCSAMNVPCVALCGTVELDDGEIAGAGLAAARAIGRSDAPLPDRLASTCSDLTLATDEVIRAVAARGARQDLTAQ